MSTPVCWAQQAREVFDYDPLGACMGRILYTNCRNCRDQIRPSFFQNGRLVGVGGGSRHYVPILTRSEQVRNLHMLVPLRVVSACSSSTVVRLPLAQALRIRIAFNCSENSVKLQASAACNTVVRFPLTFHGGSHSTAFNISRWFVPRHLTFYVLCQPFGFQAPKGVRETLLVGHKPHRSMA